MPAKPAKKKSRLAFPLGLLIVILAVVGAVATAKWGISAVSDLRSHSAKRAEYEEFLKPIVMFDPDPFDDISSADMPQLVNAAIWSLITDTESDDDFAYSQGDTMGILIPQDEVTAAFKRLFGTEVDVAAAYATIDMSRHDITYDANQGGFIIPITSLDVAYVPHVYELETQGSSVILTVGYIGSKTWADVQNGSYEAPEPDKYMKVTLRQGDEGYYVASLQAVGAQEVASNALTSAVPVSIDIRSLTETAAEASTGENTTDEAVTDENGEPVTDENGEPVTDENGESVTNRNESETVTEEGQ